MARAAKPVTTAGEERLVRWWWAIRGGLGHVGTVLMALGAILLAFGTTFGWVFAGGVVASIVGLVIQVRQRPRYRRLIEYERLAGARAQQRSGTLIAITDAGLSTLLSAAHVDATTSRASVYRHKDGKFFLMA